MQLFRVLRLLWMLRAFLGSTGTSATATSTSNELWRAALRNPTHSKGTAKWPLNSPQTSPIPDARENIPKTVSTSPHSKSLSETVLKSPISSNPPTSPTSKFVFKVETSPPTMIVYKGSTECVNPTSLIITTTYPTTTCVSQTQVSFPSSHTITPGTETPWTTISSTFPVSTTKRVTSAVTRPPPVTIAGKTPTTTAPPSSFVPTINTTPDTLISSMTGTTKRTTPAAASVHTTASPTPTVVPTSATTPSLTTRNTLITTDKSFSPSTHAMSTTSLPDTLSTFRTSTATMRAPASAGLLTTPTTPVASTATEATTGIGTPNTTPVNTTGSVKTTFIPRTDLPTETLTGSVTSVSPVMSSTSPATFTTSKSRPVPASTDTHMTSASKGPPSSTGATTEIGGARDPASHASSTRNTTFPTTTDVSAESATTEITSAAPVVTPLHTLTNTVIYPTTSTSVTTNTLTSPISKPQSPSASTTEQASTSTRDRRPFLTLTTRFPNTHTIAVLSTHKSNSTGSATEITIPTDTAERATSTTATMPTSSTTKTSESLKTYTLTTLTLTTPPSTLGNIFKTGCKTQSTEISAITSVFPNSRWTQRTTKIILSSGSMGENTILPTTTKPKTRQSTKSMKTMNDNDSKITLSRLLKAQQNNTDFSNTSYHIQKILGKMNTNNIRPTMTWRTAHTIRTKTTPINPRNPVRMKRSLSEKNHKTTTNKTTTTNKAKEGTKTDNKISVTNERKSSETSFRTHKRDSDQFTILEKDKNKVHYVLNKFFPHSGKWQNYTHTPPWILSTVLASHTTGAASTLRVTTPMPTAPPSAPVLTSSTIYSSGSTLTSAFTSPLPASAPLHTSTTLPPSSVRTRAPSSTPATTEATSTGPAAPSTTATSAVDLGSTRALASPSDTPTPTPTATATATPAAAATPTTGIISSGPTTHRTHSTFPVQATSASTPAATSIFTTPRSTATPFGSGTIPATSLGASSPASGSTRASTTPAEAASPPAPSTSGPPPHPTTTATPPSHASSQPVATEVPSPPSVTSSATPSSTLYAPASTTSTPVATNSPTSSTGVPRSPPPAPSTEPASASTPNTSPLPTDMTPSSSIVQTSINVPSSSDSAEVSTPFPSTTQSTFMDSAGSSTSMTDLSFTLSLSGTSPPTTGNIPSFPTTHNTGPTSNIMSPWATSPSETSLSPNIQSTATPFLSTSIPRPSLGPSLMPSSLAWPTQAESISLDAISMSSSMQEMGETTLASITTDLYLYQSSALGLSSTAATTQTAKTRDTALLASSALRTTATPISTVSVESLTTDITSISPITSSATQTSTVHFQTSPVSTPVTSGTLTAPSSPVSFPSFPTREPVPTETTAPTPLFTLPMIPVAQSTSTPPSPTGTFTTTRTEVTTPTHTSPPATLITASSRTPSTPEAAKTGTTQMATAPASITALSTSGVSPSSAFPILITSTNAISTPFGTIISSSIPAIMSSSTIPSSEVSKTSSSFSTSSHMSSAENTGPSSVTAFPTFSSTETTKTSSTMTSLMTSPTQMTAMLTLSSPSPCPESISVTIVSASPTTPCIEVGPNAEVTSMRTVPLSVFTSTTEMVTSPNPTTTTTLFPDKLGASPPMLDTNPSNKTAAPSSINIGRIPINTVFPSTRRPNSGTWINSNFVNTRPVPGFITFPRIVKRRRRSSSSVMTIRKLTPQSLPITRVPRIPLHTRTLSTHTSRRTTLTTTQMATQSRFISSPGICDNGGTWTQGHCFCPRTFYGSHCELAAREIYLDMVDSEVGMEVSVNQEFSADLKDNSSKVYRDFVNTFRDQIKKIYQNVQGFKEVQILSLRNGSIVVEYLVLLELPFSLQLEEEYEKVKVALKEELQNVSQDGNSCQNDQVLCFKPDSIKVNNNTRTELSPEAICRRAAAEGFEDFYFPFLEKNQLRCVTKCTAGVEGAIDCHQGQCVLQRSGPSCRCFSTDTHWFLGPRCEVAISWKALAGGLAGAGALLLLLLVVALNVFVVRSRGGIGKAQAGPGTIGSCSRPGMRVQNWLFLTLPSSRTEEVHIHRPEVVSSSP